MQKIKNVNLFNRQYLKNNKRYSIKDSIIAVRYQLKPKRYSISNKQQQKTSIRKNNNNVFNKIKKDKNKLKRNFYYNNYIDDVFRNSPYLNNQSIKSIQQSINANSIKKKLSPHNFSTLQGPNKSQSKKKIIQISRKYAQSSLNNDLLEQAKIHYDKEEYKQCITMLDKLPKLLKDNLQVNYYMGMSYISQNQFNLGVQYLQQCIKLNPKFKRSMYLILALSYKKLNKINQAIDCLTICLQNFPTYYDCLIYRGKLYLREKLYDNAKTDFIRGCQLNPQKSFAYFGKGQAQLHLKQYYQALQSYNKAINIDQKPHYYQQKGHCYYCLCQYQKALKQFQNCNQLTSINFHKGITYYQLHKYNESILYLQQCLRTDTIKNNLTIAIQTMIKIKIEEKDIYEAYYIYNRVDNLDINPNKLQNWKSFLEACLYLIKKKYQQSINIFKKMLDSYPYNEQYKNLQNQDSKIIYKFLKPKIYVYKAYGQLNLKNQEIAKLDYLLYDQLINQLKINEDNTSKRYNQLLILARQKFPKQSQKFIGEALKLFPLKAQPYLLTAFTIINSIQVQQLTQKDFLNIIQQITIGINNLPHLSNNHISSFYYYRAIINLYCNNFSNSIVDIGKAIQKSQDNIAKYFYLRGLIFSCFCNYAQAIQDFTVCLNLDTNFAKAYLERCKCLQLESDTNQAFKDLQKYITLMPDDPYIHKYAGFLLFQNCAYQDCLAAFTHGSNQIIEDIILTQAKCNLLLGRYKQSLEYFDQYKEETFSTQYLIDAVIIDIIANIHQKITNQELKRLLLNLNNLKQNDKEKNGRIFKYRQICQLKGSLELLLGNHKQALQYFFQTLGLLQQEKQKQAQRQNIENRDEFQQEWSQVQIKYNIALCHLCLQMYDDAEERIDGYQKCMDKGINWLQFIELVNLLVKEQIVADNENIELQTFLQQHKISKNWPKIKLTSCNVFLPLCFSYPFVQPPQLIPAFDSQLFLEFHPSRIEIKPQAPWINRTNQGLKFTSKIQNFNNLQISETTQNNQTNNNNQNNIYLGHSQQLSKYSIDYNEDLKKKFKLDSTIEMKLNKIIKKQK